MEKAEFEELIEKKILEARVVIAEKRLQFILVFAGAAIAIFGVIWPIWQTQQNTEKTEKAIKAMKQEIREALSAQLRKPELELYFEGKELAGESVRFRMSKQEPILLELKNKGDAKAQIDKIRIYIQTKQNFNVSTEFVDWNFLSFSEEPDFPKGYEYPFGERLINAKETFAFELLCLWGGNQPEPLPALIKIYYGQSEPKEIRFSIVFQD